jgi:hypothetical protein
MIDIKILVTYRYVINGRDHLVVMELATDRRLGWAWLGADHMVGTHSPSLHSYGLMGPAALLSAIATEHACNVQWQGLGSLL